MSISYLYTPAESIIDPPIVTNKQLLPLEQLSWEDFEKLCLAIVQTSFTIDFCEPYGKKGQSQEGIDIFAKQNNGKYRSYQCKRYKEFKVSKLNKVIKDFKGKDFYNKSEYLYLCTSCELNDKKIQDRFEELKSELKKDNITFIKWDKIQLSRILKSEPQIVFDFFGLEWLKAFNGQEAINEISNSKRFDANQVAVFRKELYTFYSTIFNIQDPGIPIGELNIPFNLQDRFIIPDILSNVKQEGFNSQENKPFSLESLDQHYYNNIFYGDSENNFRREENNNTEVENSINIRIEIDEALVENDRNVIIGDPGAGKSSLLRYLTLDVLSSSPKLENVSKTYGKSLPVWLPFAFITNHLSKDDSLSISDILKLWFESYDKNHLFDIAKEALKDERLFLIIDGIDEWTNISSAQLAISRLETIRQMYECKVLYSSRPYGFKMLKELFTNLNVLHLAGFSKDQQRKFIDKWYEKWISLQSINGDKDYSKKLSDNFVNELERTGDLNNLAQTPLLLSILIIQKMQNSVLPKNKTEALKEITQYLIKKHPVKRISDAGIVHDNIQDIDFKDVFCELAFYIQRENNDGVILKYEAEKAIAEYLEEYAGYDKLKSKKRSKELLEVGANDFGIIIEKSNDEISFGHKQFQEFLAAQRLYDSDDDDVEIFLKEYAAKPAFHQVVINFFGLMQIKQVKKYKVYFNALKKAVCKSYEKNYLSLVIYEVSLNIENTPNDILRDSFESIILDFEFETDPKYKEALLKRLLNALHNRRLSQKVQSLLLKYFPSQSNFRDIRVIGMNNNEKLSEPQLDFLKKAFVNGTLETRYSTSYVFEKNIKDKRVFDYLENLVNHHSNPDILAFVINSLITDKISKKNRDHLIESIKVELPLVQLFLFKHKVFSNKHTSDDLESVIPIFNEIPYQLKDEVVQILIEGFGKDDFLKRILIDSVSKKSFDGKDKKVIDTEIAWKVLFHSFNENQDVVHLVKDQFENERFPFSTDRHFIFQHLANYFTGNNILIPTVEEWIKNRLEEYSLIDAEVAFASIMVGSEKIKELILEGLPKTGISHWAVMALLEGWKKDDDVLDALKDYFRSVEKKKSSFSAHFISKVFDKEKDHNEAINILESILFDRDIQFRERSISSFIEIDKDYFERNVLERLIDELDTFPKDLFGQYYIALEEIIKEFHSNNKVQEYVLERIENDNNIYRVAVQYFPELIKDEDRILLRSVPLPKKLRLMIVDAFSALSVLPRDIEILLSKFEEESEREVMSDMAICLFNHLKDTNAEKVLAICKPLVFAKGIDYEAKRNIAFSGYLIVNKLDEYFEVEDVENQNKDESRRLEIFDDFSYGRSSGKLMIRSLIDNSNYLFSSSEKGLKTIVEKLKFNKDIQTVWGFLARHSTKSSVTYDHIMKYISENTKDIKNDSLISFLNRTEPKSPLLREILLNLIDDVDSRNRDLAGKMLGTNFNSDSRVYKEVKSIENFMDTGRIIALSTGWPDEPLIKEIYDGIVESQVPVDNYVRFNLKFLFQDVDELMAFLKTISINVARIQRLHQFFLSPLLNRLKKDETFAKSIKKELIGTDSINEKISFYSLLSHANIIDEEISRWKNDITYFQYDYGYDIVSNKTVRLKDVLHDFYF